ncbi:MAG: DUF3459 domain-containing protein, partial [Anaerolineae bacterium]|nr:DUF3459 domain-containing protein [Candidatus Roseilinea sp.]MDW8449805.1 DUF3459 domain-containing protein [Anaerolineae bacterium]
AKAGDSRWVHRPRMDWTAAARRHDPSTIQGRIFGGLKRLIALRKAEPALATLPEHVETGNAHVLGFAHYHAGGPLLVLANFSEQAHTISAHVLHAQGLSWPTVDLITGSRVALSEDVTLAPYQMAWLKPS